jgi:hypothetical protein
MTDRSGVPCVSPGAPPPKHPRRRLSFSLDHQREDLLKAAGAVLTSGAVLLSLVGYRNSQAGKALAYWQPDLASPTAFTGHTGRRRPSGGGGYLAGLLTATVQRRLTRSACQRRSVRGVTNRWCRRCRGSSRASAERIARSAHDGWGAET